MYFHEVLLSHLICTFSSLLFEELVKLIFISVVFLFVFFCLFFFKQTIKSLSSNIETLKKEVELTAMAAKSKESPSQARQIVSRHSELVLSRTLFCSNSQVQQNLSHKHTVL